MPLPVSRSNRSRRRVAAPALAVALGLSAMAAVPASAAPIGTQALVDIDIVSINDFHGRLEASPPGVTPAIGGAAVLGGMVDAYEAANPNTLFVSAGDSIGASTFTSFIQDDEPTLDALNRIGLDASALGNHEFDRGRADVDGRVLPDSEFPYLGANVYEKGTQTPAYEEYSIQEVDGVSVGFIGAVTESMPTLVTPSAIATLDFGPIVPAVNRVADQLSDGDDANGEADVLLLLVHEGAANGDIATAAGASAFGQITSGVNGNVDAIISAHTHQVYNHDIPAAGLAQRPVIQSGPYGENFGHISMSVDNVTGELTSIESEVLPLAGEFDPDPEIEDLVADAVVVADREGAVPLGELTDDFNRARQSDGTTENRGGESTLGNFVADVQLWSTQDAGSQIALMNPGGLRTDLTFAASDSAGDADGVITYREAAEVQPFANTLVALDLTTEQLESVLEQQWQPAGSDRPFLKLGASESLKYAYDPAAPEGERITAIYVEGVLAAPGQSFRTTVNSFLASGGDGFLTFAEGTNAQDTGQVDLQSMADYLAFLAENDEAASPDYAQRAVGVTTTPAPAGGFVAGDQVTVDLSSLLFSTTEPNAGTVELSLGGTVLGSSDIDPAVVDTTDEVGRASVTFTVPSGVVGSQVLTVAVAETGTTIDVPILLAEGELAATGGESSAAWMLAYLLLGGGLLLVGGTRVARRRRMRA